MTDSGPVRAVQATASAFSDPAVFLTERVGGVSPAPFDTLNLGRSTPDDPERIWVNEARAVAALGVADRVARIHLEHGGTILRAEEAGVVGTGDALFTESERLTLSLSVADCYPVALVHGPRRALVHCGWRSVDAAILESLVGQSEFFPEPRETHAWIGPGIGPCCYPVGPEVAVHFPASLEVHGEATHLDLGSEIRTRLHALGVPSPQVEFAGLCTSCHPERFFSHRRDGFPAGRMAAFFG